MSIPVFAMSTVKMRSRLKRFVAQIINRSHTKFHTVRQLDCIVMILLWLVFLSCTTIYPFIPPLFNAFSSLVAAIDAPPACA